MHINELLPFYGYYHQQTGKKGWKRIKKEETISEKIMTYNLFLIFLIISSSEIDGYSMP